MSQAKVRYITDAVRGVRWELENGGTTVAVGKWCARKDAAVRAFQRVIRALKRQKRVEETW